MRKLLILTGILLLSCTNVFAAKIPVEVKDYILQKVPQADIRFDGVIIFPDNTIYLPLYPALFSDVSKIQIKETHPAKQDLKQEPDVVIFNNDFVLMKVLTDGEGHRTVLHMPNPPLQVRTGLLPHLDRPQRTGKQFFRLITTKSRALPDHPERRGLFFVQIYSAPAKVAAMTALMVCMRFSASSNTTDWLLSNTSSVTSRPSLSP